MKRIITMLLCVCLLCSSTLCFAEDPISGVDGEVVTVTQNNGTYATASNPATEQPILTNVEYTQEGGRNLIAKTYEVPVNFDVQKLAEADFQDRGMQLPTQRRKRILSTMLILLLSPMKRVKI